MRRFNFRSQPHNFYGRFSRLQSRRDRSFLENGGSVAFLALNSLHGQRYWTVKDMFERFNMITIVRG